MDLQGLNQPQRLAVETTEGPLLILAGAGSGKTRVITHRIAYLIDNKHVSPYEIMALTFTNKAAREMKERVQSLIGPMSERVWVSTFHASCARILRIDIEQLGTFTRDFVIYDETDQLALISEVQQELKIKEDIMPKRMLRFLFSDAKNRFLNPEEYLKETGRDRNTIVLDAFVRYQKKLRKNNALDFDDLLLRTLELFQKVPEVLEKYQERFRYIHVDEYQDTNTMQYEFIRLIAKKHKNLCVVGDDDQSIYGWRGADLRNILDFERDYANAKVIRLEQNYRSTKTILEAANAVIAYNSERKEKTLWTQNTTGEKIDVYNAFSDRDEADFICRTITDQRKTIGKKYSDFAVLYRTNAQSRIIEDTLVAYGIPYTVYGSLRFYDRKEVKDVLAYLRLIVNPHDDVSLRRIINIPKRGIGNAAIEELQGLAEQHGLSLFDVCIQSEQLALSNRIKNKIQDFAGLMVQLRALYELMPLSDFINEMLELTGYWTYIEEEQKKEGRLDNARKENISELISATVEFEKSSDEIVGEHDTLSAFLENVALVANLRDETDPDSVTLMTMHSSKGLEFPIVFIAGMEENIFPSSRAVREDNGLEEERRLCYVGITRAMEKLYLSHAQSRMQYQTVTRNPQSRFLLEIPDELWQSSNTGFAKSTNNFYGFEDTPSSLNKPTQNNTKAKIPQKNAGTSKGIFEFDIKKTQKTKKTFALYDTVIHAKFGEGQVIGIENDILTIDFQKVGQKKIAASYAPLQKKQ